MTTPVNAAAEQRVLAGDSAEQRAAEVVIVAAIARQLNVKLSKGRREVAGSIVELDAYSEDPPVLVEAWAHQGPPRPAQKYKVMTDALKLNWVEAELFPKGARKILALTDGAAAAHFRGSSWMAEALRRFKIDVVVVDLTPSLREAILAAQKRQFR